MRKKKTYRAPGLYVHKMARLHILANTATTEDITKGSFTSDFLDVTIPPEGTTEGIDQGSFDDEFLTP